MAVFRIGAYVVMRSFFDKGKEVLDIHSKRAIKTFLNQSELRLHSLSMSPIAMFIHRPSAVVMGQDRLIECTYDGWSTSRIVSVPPTRESS